MNTTNVELIGETMMMMAQAGDGKIRVSNWDKNASQSNITPPNRAAEKRRKSNKQARSARVANRKK